MWWRHRPFRAAVAGDSMEPVLRDGDFVVALRRADPVPGDVVVVHLPGRGREGVKRVARITPAGYWVAGDNPVASTDSRTFGPVPFDAVAGVVRLRYWPRPRLL
ncbi:MAG: S26 family signal peptidase [Actinomycetota bacterium]|nr:S26 family signal peptidase [Actinomycetota bacterium]